MQQQYGLVDSGNNYVGGDMSGGVNGGQNIYEQNYQNAGGSSWNNGVSRLSPQAGLVIGQDLVGRNTASMTSPVSGTGYHQQSNLSFQLPQQQQQQQPQQQQQQQQQQDWAIGGGLRSMSHDST